RDRQETARGYGAAAEFLNATRPARSGLALHFSHQTHFIRKNQPMIAGFQYQETMIRRIYHPLIQAQLRPDVIHPVADLSPYRVVLSPYEAALDEEGLRGRVKAWIEAGGTWITGPQSDIRTTDGAKFTHAPFGSLEEWTGAWCRFTVPSEPIEFHLRWSVGALAGVESTGWQWYDAFEPRAAEALAVYTDGPMEGLAAAVRRRMGKGQIVVLGTMPPPEIWQKLVLELSGQAGVAPAADASANLMVAPREGTDGRPAGVVVVELENKPARLKLDREATDLLTGRKLRGEVEIAPFAVLALKY
ncbi:MAG: beta-galactosidase trimerization domain-containing protein, partial [bacterium]|nr:beta-galactosidase trimerization domain-containing protein [bacterium]